MATYKNNIRKKAEVLATPSRFGSHASMAVEGAEAPEGMIVLLDNLGQYTTYVDRLDTGFADAIRWGRSAPSHS